MLPYWLMFLLPAMPALASRPRRQVARRFTGVAALEWPWLLVLLGLTVMIGFRHEVGGDWFNYLEYIEEAKHLAFAEALALEDPGYWLLNVISVQRGWGITGVNVLSGLIFSTGLVLFCRNCPRPWLALTVAMPYLVIVVGMGYARQAVALGLCLIAFLALERRQYLRFLLWVLLAATFHKSAALLIPLAGITATRNRWVIVGFSILLLVGAYYTLIVDSFDRLVTQYIDSEMQSYGAQIRLFMNAIPAALFLVYKRHIDLSVEQYKLWRNFSIISIGMLLVVYITPYSTALDRMALYILPLQLIVFCRLPDLVSRSGREKSRVVLGIISYYALVLYVWLNFALHAYTWVPYRIAI